MKCTHECVGDVNEQILDLYLQGWSEAETGSKVTLSRPRVAELLKDVRKGINSQIDIPDTPDRRCMASRPLEVSCPIPHGSNFGFSSLRAGVLGNYESLSLSP